MLTQKPDQAQIETTIHEELCAIMAQRGCPIMPAIDGDALLNDELHFSSIDLAQLLVALESRLEADPFAEHVSITSVHSVRDLVGAYRGYFEQA